MKTKVYAAFEDKHGNKYGFADYLSFATFWFSIHRKTLVATFAPEVFKKLNACAVSSREARKPMFQTT